MSVGPDATRTPAPRATTAHGARALIAQALLTAQVQRAVMVPRVVRVLLRAVTATVVRAVTSVVRVLLRAVTATVVKAATRSAKAHRAVKAATRAVAIVAPIPAAPPVDEASRSAVVPVVNAPNVALMIAPGTMIL